MAEYLLRDMYGNEYEVESAGETPAKEVNPLAKEVMSEIGIDISAAKPKHFNNLENKKFDYIISVCDAKAEDCPVFVFGVVPLNLGIPDPTAMANAAKRYEKKLKYFRSARDEIRQIIRNSIVSIERKEKDKVRDEKIKESIERDFQETVGNEISAYLREAMIVSCPPGEKIICIQETQLELILRNEIKKLNNNDIWYWLAFSVTMLATVTNASFKSNFLSADQWEIIFIIGFFVSVSILCYKFYQRINKNDKVNFIRRVIDLATGRQIFDRN
jgi:arsenate reductase